MTDEFGITHSWSGFFLFCQAILGEQEKQKQAEMTIKDRWIGGVCI